MADLIAPKESRHPAAAQIDVVRFESQEFEIIVDGHPRCRVPAHDVTDELVRILNRLVLDLDDRRVHLHGGLVELHGAGILLAGPSGAGKTTVTAELVRSGAAYLTDEIVTLTPGSGSIDAYAKPLTIKRAERAEWRDLAYSSGGRAFLAASQIGSVAAWTTPSTILIVHFDPSHARPVLNPVSRTTTCRMLLADSLDAARYGSFALDLVARLVTASRCATLHYADASTVPDQVGDLLSQAVNPSWTQLLQPPGVGWRVACFDDGALLFDAETRIVLELEAPEVEAFYGSGSSNRQQVPRQVWDRLRAVGLSVPSDRSGGSHPHLATAVLEGRESLDGRQRSVDSDVIAMLLDCGASLLPGADHYVRNPPEFDSEPTFLMTPAALDVAVRRFAGRGHEIVKTGEGLTLIDLLNTTHGAGEDTTGGSVARVRLRSQIALPPFDRLVDIEVVSGRARMERVSGTEVRVVDPVDAFLIGCLDAGTRLRPPAEALDRVRVLAPATLPAIWLVQHQAAERNGAAVVARAVRLASRCHPLPGWEGGRYRRSVVQRVQLGALLVGGRRLVQVALLLLQFRDPRQGRY